jgi:hypothetical protein
MSAFIPPITPGEAPAQQPSAGSVSTLNGNVVVTDSNANSENPVAIATDASLDVAAGTQGLDILLDGTPDSTIDIDTAVDANGNPLSASGTSFQVDDNYEGTVNANLENAIVDGTKVDLETDTGTGTIADNAPPDAGQFDFYVNSGQGDDDVKGSVGDDFVRLGAGNDKFDTGAGNDLVRLGTGNDEGFLGAGDDKIYLTIDQLQEDGTKTIKDFDADGDDKIQIESGLDVTIEGQGTNTITITLAGNPDTVTTITSEGETIDDDDIEFV